MPSEIFIFPPKWIPDTFQWENYPKSFSILPFGRFALNSARISGLVILGYMLSAPLAGFAFARLRFPGRDVLFVFVLSSMMLPYTVTMVPHYILFNKLGWIDSIKPLVVPSFLAGQFAGAFFIFLLRQFFLTIPNEMNDAARIDGCNTFQMYYRIFLPQAKPAIGIIAVYSFMWTWNDFLMPLIYLKDLRKFTFAVGLSFFQGAYQTYWHLLMAATVIAILPCIVVFMVAQKAFIQGIVVSGVKG